MSVRDAALRELNRRIAEAANVPARILDPDALLAASALLGATAPYPDANAAIALARHRWACATALTATATRDGRTFASPALSRCAPRPLKDRP
ncbi:hypothetical protein L3Q65_09750 [Amycolatopsis sp. FU40]|uniref:hypothetical protein n=1 Tax=Amycolatopsis sp. FU40 TaxID=2914159 RepID=UPI001F28A622|nr:hypothetical protein [Amycolatopsis sp. FU40]UKD56982.1 hypothetical protein L3Q65_09750 [Amycolatopsis sp. FU40]